MPYIEGPSVALTTPMLDVIQPGRARESLSDVSHEEAERLSDPRATYWAKYEDAFGAAYEARKPINGRLDVHRTARADLTIRHNTEASP